MDTVASLEDGWSKVFSLRKHYRSWQLIKHKQMISTCTCVPLASLPTAQDMIRVTPKSTSNNKNNKAQTMQGIKTGVAVQPPLQLTTSQAEANAPEPPLLPFASLCNAALRLILSLAYALLFSSPGSPWSWEYTGKSRDLEPGYLLDW